MLKPSNSDTKTKKPDCKVSVIIPFRNEEKNLPFLIEGLKNQAYQNVEFIFVNDHSEDKSIEIIENAVENDNRFIIKTLPADKQGKKAAVEFANSLTESDYILYTDADCTVQSLWVEKTVLFMVNNELDFCSGTVCFSKPETLIEKIQTIEFAQLVGIGHALIKLKSPVMCNGANMAISKRLIGANLKSNISSGDDVFLLHYAFKNNYKISYINDLDTVVTTSAMPTFTTWFKQRVRWLSKSGSYRNLNALLITGFIGLSQLIFITLFFVCDIQTVIIVWLIKITVEILFYRTVSRLYNSYKSIFIEILLGLIYPFFTVLVGVGSIFYKGRWKGRNVLK